MASEDIAYGQHCIECDVCKQPVSFFCRRCGVNLCDPCVPAHLRIKSKIGHDVVDYVSRDDYDPCTCDSYPQNDCSAYCLTCDVPICKVCVSNKHRSHKMSALSEKIEEFMRTITKNNELFQNHKRDISKMIDHTTKHLGKSKKLSPFQFCFAKITPQNLNSLSKIYQQKKNEVMSRGEELHRQIDKTVKALHQELDDMQKEHESLLHKQKREFEEILGKIDEINAETMKLKSPQNVLELKELNSMIENQEIPSDITQYSFPVFCKSKIDDNYLKSYFGYIENIQERKVPLPRFISEEPVVSNHKALEVPEVMTAIDTEFPADKKYNSRLLAIAVIDDNRVVMGGASTELKLFDFHGNLHDTVPITTLGMYLTVHNKHVIYTTQISKTVRRVADDKTVQTMFTTGEWIPRGITSTASDDLLVCLLKDDQSKVVRYSSIGTVHQEIQYDSQGQPLYRQPAYITENVNGDIIVTDVKNKVAIAVDRLGIFRFSYSGRDTPFHATAITTDPAGHIIVTDSGGHKIHMLDRDGRFLRYLIPDQGIKYPRAVCVVGDGEMFVGERVTGIAKRIKYLEQ